MTGVTLRIPIAGLFLAALGLAPGALAQQGAAAPATPAATTATHEQGAPPAPLVIGNRTITTLRATVLGHSPRERAASAWRRAVLAYKANPKLNVDSKVVAEGATILVGGTPLLLIVDGDVDRLGGETPEGQANLAVERMRAVLEELREREDPRALLTAAGLVAVATLIWILILRGLVGLDRWAGNRLAAAVDRQVGAVKAAGVRLLDSGHFLSAVRRIVRFFAWALGALVTFLWLNSALEAVPHTRPWGDQLTRMLLETLGTIGTAILDSLPGLLFVVVILVIARFVTQASRAFFDRVRQQDLKLGWLDRDTAAPTRMLFSVVVWLFALAMAYPYLPGSESRAFQGLSVLVGLMVSIGASGTVGQAASGLILMYTRAFRVGEFVRFGETEGTVVDLGLFATRVRTGMGEEVMLPNSVVLGSSSKNYSRAVPGTGFVLDATVTIGYDTPWRQVEAMLIEAARRVDTIVQDPAPLVFQTALSDFYPEYRLVAYAKPDEPLPRAVAISQLHAQIQDVFNEHGVQIMSPHYLGDPAQAKLVPKEKWFEAPAKPPSDSSPRKS